MQIKIFYTFFLIVFGSFSYLYLSAYRFGDQFFYQNFYLNLTYAPVGDILFLQSFYTGSSEPLFGLIAWVGAKLSIEKNIYFSMLNAAFGVSLLLFLKNNAASTLYIILAFLNYYIFVMLGPAERLKVAFLFLLIAINFNSRPVIYVFMLCALLSHFQMGILLLSTLVGTLSKIQLSAPLLKKKLIRILPVALSASIIGFLLLFLFWPMLLSKIQFYHNESGLLAIAKISLLMMCALAILKQKIQILLILAATMVFASVLGAERINMIAFFIFSFFVIKQQKTDHLLILLMMSYFAVKGLYFVGNVYVYGTGY